MSVELGPTHSVTEKRLLQLGSLNNYLYRYLAEVYTYPQASEDNNNFNLLKNIPPIILTFHAFDDSRAQLYESAARSVAHMAEGSLVQATYDRIRSAIVSGNDEFIQLGAARTVCNFSPQIHAMFGNYPSYLEEAARLGGERAATGIVQILRGNLPVHLEPDEGDEQNAFLDTLVDGVKILYMKDPPSDELYKFLLINSEN